MTLRIYLAGPINGCADDEAFGWRRLLHGYAGTAIVFVDPMDRDERGKEDDSWEEIVSGDKADIDSCDAIIANCWKTSVGTTMEILYAHERGKRVIVVVPEGKPISPWYRAHSEAVVPHPITAYGLLVGD